ncbi:MAG: hypothetical protein GF347_02425 [Candidatus Moranbacteria bacterium]|nr:hypothetical protein [Candidatus Moranbacteria bacterium]
MPKSAVKSEKIAIFKKKPISFFLISAFFLILTGLIVYYFYFTKEIPDQPLKIGFTTDIHCYGKLDKDINEWRLNWRCLEPFNYFIKKMNTGFKPDLVIDGGDLIDGRGDNALYDFRLMMEKFDRIKAQKYFVLGNHETDNFDKRKWLELTGQENTYYYFDKKGYRIIVLDGNNVLEEDGTISGAGPDNQFYPGVIDQRQMEWLKKLLQESRKKQILVFIHQPIIEKSTVKESNEFLRNAGELRKLFSKYKVLGVFSGHIEELCYLNIDGVSYYVQQGFFKENKRLPFEETFKNQGVFSEITVIKDQIKVDLFYRDGEGEEIFHSIPFDETTAVCNNNTIN